MLERKSKNTQDVDARLMASLNAIHPVDSGQFFPASKKSVWHKPKAKPVQPAAKTVPSVPVPPAPKSTTHIEKPTKELSGPTRQVSNKKPLLLLAPLGVFFLLFLTSITFRSLGLPFMSTDTETALSIVVSLLEIPCIVALGLYYLGNIRRKYIFAPAAGLTSSQYNERFIPVSLVVWPFLVMLLYMIFLVVLPAGDISLGPLNGLLYLMVITGFPSFALGLILFALLLAYRKEIAISYPSFIFVAIDYINRKLG